VTLRRWRRAGRSRVSNRKWRTNTNRYRGAVFYLARPAPISSSRGNTCWLPVRTWSRFHRSGWVGSDSIATNVSAYMRFVFSDGLFHTSSTRGARGCHVTFDPKRLIIMLHSSSVDTATGSYSGFSVLLKDTSTRAGIEPPTP